MAVEIVKLRLFAGLSVEEAADALGLRFIHQDTGLFAGLSVTERLRRAAELLRNLREDQLLRLRLLPGVEQRLDEILLARRELHTRALQRGQAGVWLVQCLAELRRRSRGVVPGRQ